mgnify:CR=1 FL=1
MSGQHPRRDNQTLELARSVTLDCFCRPHPLPLLPAYTACLWRFMGPLTAPPFPPAVYLGKAARPAARNAMRQIWGRTGRGPLHAAARGPRTLYPPRRLRCSTCAQQPQSP